MLSQLHSLDTRSALHVLLSLTPLARYEERRVLELLQPAPSGAGPLSSPPHLPSPLVL